ncbi:MAG: LacI family DNA-binding transcriptional regulator [Lentilitoribacter sp.]
MPVTAQDVADKAGVSRSAVSRAFTPGASVSARMRKRVEDAAKDLGYSPNVLASSLTTRRTKLIGLVSDNFQNPLFLEVFDLFSRGLQEKGLRPLLLNLSGEHNPENSVHLLRQYSVDGVIVASSTLPPGFAKAFSDEGIPIVHSFGRHAISPAVTIVGIDNVECGRMAAQALLTCGYTSVGFIGGPELASSTQDRVTGFREEIAKHPEVHVTHSYANAYSFKAGRAEMQRLLKHKPQQAYFCGDDALAVGAMSAAEDAGYNVPADIGFIGLNDMEIASWQNINLTTIKQPITDIINSSLELMFEMLEDPDHEPQAKIFPCEIIERGTLIKKT